MTRELKQVTPFQICPHGSPPLELHCVRIGGEFKLLYMAFRAETAQIMKVVRYPCVLVTKCVQIMLTIAFQLVYLPRV